MLLSLLCFALASRSDAAQSELEQGGTAFYSALASLGSARRDAMGVPLLPPSAVGPLCGSAPLHVRLAYGTSPQSEMWVSWTSFDAKNQASVLIGSAPGVYDLPMVNASAPITYAKGDGCGTMKGYTAPGFFHHALVSGLEAGRRYYFRPVQNGIAGKESSFVTGTALGPDVPVRFAAYGDQYISAGDGAAATASHLVERISSDNPLQFVLHVGDVSYGRGDVGIWNTWRVLEDYGGQRAVSDSQPAAHR